MRELIEPLPSQKRLYDGQFPLITEEDVQQMRDAGTAEQRTREERQDFFSDTPQMTHPVAPSTDEEREAFFR